MNGLIGLIVCALVAVVYTEESNSTLLTSKIIGGTGVQVGTYTFAVYLTSSGILRCGAALISIRGVLSAGNCAAGLDLSPNSLTIIIGTHRSTPSQADQMYFSCGVSFHDYFLDNQPTNLADFAVITLRRDAELQSVGGYATLISLSDEEICAGRNALVLGWGFVSPANTISNVLRSLAVTIIDNIECGNRLKAIIDSTQICAISLAENRANFAARDLGGPLVYRRSATDSYKIIGIASVYNNDPALPGVYTRVSSFYRNIRSMTPDYPQDSMTLEDDHYAWSGAEDSSDERTK